MPEIFNLKDERGSAVNVNSVISLEEITRGNKYRECINTVLEKLELSKSPNIKSAVKLLVFNYAYEGRNTYKEMVNRYLLSLHINDSVDIEVSDKKFTIGEKELELVLMITHTVILLFTATSSGLTSSDANKTSMEAQAYFGRCKELVTELKNNSGHPLFEQMGVEVN